MKTVRTIALIIFCSVLAVQVTSCKKKVTGPNTVWIGSWYSEDGTEKLTIAENGAGEWQFYENGVTKSIQGRVKFESGSFKIKALGFKKEFTINQEPTACDPSVNYYDCTYAKLNGKEFLKL